ncbi:MAG: hypothetical protein QM687_02745 [Ferruginibacter sp.]
MKKLFFAVAALIALNTASFAQTTPAAKKAEVAKVQAAKTTKTTVAAQPAVAKTTLKKDGTPDMRYKANKLAAAKKTHLKKDGTADKRFKENKS